MAAISSSFTTNRKRRSDRHSDNYHDEKNDRGEETEEMKLKKLRSRSHSIANIFESSVEANRKPDEITKIRHFNSENSKNNLNIMETKREDNQDNKNYRWISFPVLSSWDQTVLSRNIVRMFILQNLKIAFRPDFRDLLLDYIISFDNLELLEEYLSLFQIPIEILMRESDDQKRNAMINNKIIDGTNKLWDAVLKEITATESALLYRLRLLCPHNYDISLEPLIETQTWENNYFLRTKWTVGNKRGLYQDSNEMLANLRNDVVDKLFNEIKIKCDANPENKNKNDDQSPDEYPFGRIIEQVCGNRNVRGSYGFEGIYEIVLTEEIAYRNREHVGTAIVLLDGNPDFTYLGHVYFLADQSDYLEAGMQSIRSSIINNILTKCNFKESRSNIAKYLLEAAKIVACNQGKIRIRALGTIGGMGQRLEKLGGWTTQKPGYAADYIYQLNCNQ